MFTGIVEEVGTVRALRRGAHSATLSIGAHTVFENTRLGDSIAVNGVCLTVTSLGPNQFSADVMHETLRHSNLGSLHAGSPVNLERAMAADGRFGGHVVSGHIDAVGTIRRIQHDDNAVWYTIDADEGTLRHIIMKGSIAIDGISLTVARLASDSFSVSIIPHTRAETTLPTKQIGDEVNLETDLIGKYVERFLAMPSSPPSTAVDSGGITRSFLATHGF